MRAGYHASGHRVGRRSLWIDDGREVGRSQAGCQRVPGTGQEVPGRSSGARRLRPNRRNVGTPDQGLEGARERNPGP